ncbi:hypothetical protein CEXT_168331 [Caerostris extrusa]|uniref:Uncharacterized protein n=1 Tax=Caerostris extrusa TaxID=172846 RepID=A0AAV4Y4M1_CAEEX|nr:hypothetical protein CEXT_168331 [Caerostris extrusa]
MKQIPHPQTTLPKLQVPIHCSAFNCVTSTQDLSRVDYPSSNPLHNTLSFTPQIFSQCIMHTRSLPEVPAFEVED